MSYETFAKHIGIVADARNAFLIDADEANSRVIEIQTAYFTGASLPLTHGFDLAAKLMGAAS